MSSMNRIGPASGCVEDCREVLMGNSELYLDLKKP